MASEQDNLENDPEFKRLRHLRAKLSLRYSLLLLSIFAAFILVVVGFPDTVAVRLSSRAVFTLAIALGFFLMLLPAFMAALFLRRTDSEIEPLRAKLAERRRS